MTSRFQPAYTEIASARSSIEQTMLSMQNINGYTLEHHGDGTWSWIGDGVRRATCAEVLAALRRGRRGNDEGGCTCPDGPIADRHGHCETCGGHD